MNHVPLYSFLFRPAGFLPFWLLLSLSLSLFPPSLPAVLFFSSSSSSIRIHPRPFLSSTPSQSPFWTLPSYWTFAFFYPFVPFAMAAGRSSQDERKLESGTAANPPPASSSGGAGTSLPPAFYIVYVVYQYCGKPRTCMLM